MTKSILFPSLLDYGYYCRAIVVTFYALILFRLSSSRILGQHSFFDLIIFIMLGAILGDAVIDKAHFLPSLIVCGIIVFIHKLLAFMSFQNQTFGKWIRGQKMVFFKAGKWDENLLNRCYMSQAEILQSLRCIHGIDDLAPIDEIAMERNGQLSFTFDENPR